MKCELYHDEQWKDIPGYEGLYQASNYGQIRSLDNIQHVMFRGKSVIKLKHGKIIKQGKHRGGYVLVWLSKNGSVRAHTVHRLVAETFLPNPDELPEINHIDGNKKNNAITNLEWVSRSENLNHAYKCLGRKNGLERKIVCVETGVAFKSIQQAAEEYGITGGAIQHALCGRNKTAKGLHWQYEM